MSFNGSGTFLINSTGQPVVANTVISATVFNALTADLASGLTNCITKDGQSTPTANIPMGNNKLTGLAVGTVASDAATLGQVQSTVAKLIGTIAGTDVITGTMSPTLTAYAAGQLFYFVAGGANTGAVTLNIDGLGAKAVTRDGSTALAGGDINSGEIVVVIYDGTRFQMINAANSFGNTTINGTLTVTGKSNLAEVSSPSINASVAVINTLTATGASAASANVGTAVVTNLVATGASIASANVVNLQATGASVASVNAGVALLTTATVTNLTATGASIASANIGALTLAGISVASANFGVAVVTDLRATGASVTSANVGTAVITTGTVTTLTATGASVASANAGVANVTDLRAAGASVTSANVGTAVITTGTVTNLTATSASVASANLGVALVTTGTVTNLTATGASIASANAGNLQVTGASVASANVNVALITTGTVTNLTSTAASIASANLGTAVITTLTATGASVASANVGVAATTTLTAVQASIGSANLSTARFLGSSSGYVGIQAAAAAGSTTYTLPSADGTSGQVLATNGTGTLSWTSAGGGGTGDVVGPASATDNAITRFDQTTGKLIQNSTVILDDAGTITGVASLAAVTASITSANADVAVITTLTATGASIASANVGTAVVTTGAVTNLTATSASVASMNAGVALVTTGTITTLTSTQASVASANLGTAVITTLTATGASIASANIGPLIATNVSVTSLNDQYGYIRDVPQSGSNKTTAYTLSAGDTGRFIGVGSSGSIVIPNAVMATGDVVTLYNATTGNITVECSISIAYIAGTNTDKASVTLATRGVATVLFLDSNNCVITGNVT